MSQQTAEGLSFLLPVHNQAAVIERVLSAWSTLLERLGREFEILVIDDGSTDSTRKLLESAAKRIANLRILDHQERRGFGAALRTGLAASQHPLLFYTACDHSYNPADLRRMLERINESDPDTGRKIDVVNGYRAGTPVTGWPATAGRIKRVFLRVALGLHADPPHGWLGKEAHRYGRKLRALFGLRIGDVDSKFKLFRRRILDRIPIQSDGDFVHAEILIKANFLGCLMDEMAIAVNPGPFPSQAELHAPISRGKELRRVFFNPDFGPPTLTPAAASAPAV